MSQVLTIIGNVTNDVELKFTPQGKAVAKFGVATSERFKKDDGEWDSRNLTYWNIIVWDKQAENIADSIGKGDEVIVYGKAYTTSWEDKNTGEKRSRMEVTATKVAVSLARASAKITKSFTRSDDATTNDAWNTPANDPWSTPATVKEADTPPF